jgi:transposase-like protein
MPNGRKFTQEFKLEAVQLCKNTWKTVAKVARELDVDPSGLYKWIKEYNAKESAAQGKGNVAHDRERFDLKTE